VGPFKDFIFGYYLLLLIFWYSSACKQQPS